MASKAKPQQRQSDVIFLSCDLDKQLRKDLVAWVAQERDYFDMIEKAVDSHLKFGAGYDNYNACFQATLTQPSGVESGSKTLVLVGRGASLLQALQALFFKFSVMCQGTLEDGDMRNPRGITDWG